MAEKPVITTTDAGGPLDVVADRRTGSSSSRASRPSRRPVRTCSGTRTRPGRGARRAARSPSGCPGARRPRRWWRPGREDGVLLADGAVAVGDRGLLALLLPALAARTGIEVVRQGSRKQPRGTDLALYHVGNDPEAHGWILEACAHTPASRSSTSGCSTTSSRD